MPIVADTHLHIYPAYSPVKLFDSALTNLMRYAPADIFLCLTERFDCDYFSKLKTKGAHGLDENFSVHDLNDQAAVRIQNSSGTNFYVIAGRQIRSKENIEVLSLCSTFFWVDKELGLAELVDKIYENAGVPVLNWAPGKWFSTRGEVVRKVIENSSNNRILLADVSLRPIGWPKPKLFKLAESKNIKIIAGSDPLPFSGEEESAGRYAVFFDETADLNCPSRSFRELLFNNSNPHIIGTRDYPWRTGYRLFRNELIRRTSHN